MIKVIIQDPWSAFWKVISHILLVKNILHIGRINIMRIRNRVSKIVVLLGAFIILGPLYTFQDKYIFTIHDYLDSWPSLFEVLRRSNLFFAPDSKMPIMNGVSTCYLYFDFGIYRLFNYFFGPIWGEIVNKTLGIIIGYKSAKCLLISLIKNKKISVIKNDDNEDNRVELVNNEWIIVLLAGAYAYTGVYPNWTISFAVLPLYINMLLKIMFSEEVDIISNVLSAFLFGFLIYFPCIGIFVFGFFLVAFFFSLIKNKKIDFCFLLYLFLMTISIVISNINVFIYVIRGDRLNRELFSKNADFNIKAIFDTAWNVGINGQYHAAPILKIIQPLCLILYLVLFWQLLKKRDLNRIVVPTTILFLDVLFCIIYALNDKNIIAHLVAYFSDTLAGFNFGRVVFINNILWYILAVVLCFMIDKNEFLETAVFVVLVCNIVIVILTPGLYKDTHDNIFHSKSMEDGKVSFSEFFDREYFQSLKEDINYNNEGVISVGYHPAVAMYNGFNTIDGYLCINPLDYHYKFRNIIAPTLEKYPALAEYYDDWGGRLYCYYDDKKDVSPKRYYKSEKKELLIDTDSFYEMGGRYIISAYELSNYEKLDLVLIEHKTDFETSIYKTWIYMVDKDI